MLKRTLLCQVCGLALLAALFVNASGQIPKTLSYQGMLANAAGTPVPDGAYSITFKLYEVASGGSALWNETQSVTVLKGVFSVVLGTITPLTLAFDKAYWIGTTVGAEAELVPRIALTTSPYSFNAQTVNGYKVNPTPTANLLLPLDGSGKFPASAIPPSPGSGLTLPHSGSASSSSAAFSVTNAGSGPAVEAGSNGTGTILSGKSGANVVLSVDHYGSVKVAPATGAANAALTIENTLAKNAINIDQQNGSIDAVYVKAASGIGEGFQVDKEGGSGICFQATTKGTGQAGYFTINNSANSSNAVYASTNGTGSATYVQISNSNNTDDALYAATNGKGNGLRVNHTGSAGDIALLQSGSDTKVTIDKNGNTSTEGYLLSSQVLGSTATPTKNALYSDNIIRVWAAVSTSGTLQDGFGCTSERTATGTYRITYKNSLTQAFVPVVTAFESTKPQFAVISSSGSTGCTVKVWQFNTTSKTFELVDSVFYLIVVGRH